MDIVRGSVVKSKAGHDKENFLLVIDIDGQKALVCDGKHRKLTNPKQKNVKHLSATKTVVELPQTNKQLRNLLNKFSMTD